MDFSDRRGLMRLSLVAALACLLLAPRPTGAWQFRDITEPAKPSSPREVSPAAENPDRSAPAAESPQRDSQPPSDSQPARSPQAEPQDRAAVTKPSSDPAEIRPIRFNQVSAGITTAKELQQLWGAPLKVTDTDGIALWKYKIAPFPQVDVTIVQDVVSSVLIYLAEPLEPGDVAREMVLETYVPVPIPDAAGRVMGQAYPERGILLSFTQDLEDAQVERMQLEPISAELFALRAEYDFQQQYQRDLADLDTALTLDPNFARAHWWRAKILGEVGQFRLALQAADSAVRLEPTSTAYRLTRAQLLALCPNAPRRSRSFTTCWK